MATAIDSLFLELGVDASQLDKGQQDALTKLNAFKSESTKVGNAIESQQKRSFDLLLDMRRQALTVLGVFLGGRGVEEFTNYITRTDVALSNLSKTLNMSATDINAWGIAFQQIGGTPESARSALAGTTQALETAKLHGDFSAFRSTSLVLGDVRGFKNAGDLWFAAAAKFQELAKKDPAFAANWLSTIPGANQDMVNFALRGGAYDRNAVRNAAATNPITPADEKVAQDYLKAATNLDSSLTSLGRVLTTIIGPPLTAIANVLTNWLTGQDKASVDKKSADQQKLFEEQQAGTRNFWHSLHNRFPFIPDMAGSDGSSDTSWAGSLGSGPSSAAGGGDNWSKYLRGLSYLETNVTNAQASPGHSAAGYFQFEPSTAAKAVRAGIGDPRSGSYDDQESKAKAYIKKFYPDAAAAIERGDTATADRLLKGEWPSVPGGSQSQSASRYLNRAKMMQGPAPGAAMAASSGVAMPAGAGGGAAPNVTIGTINVNAPQAKDANGIAQAIAPQLQRTISASLFNGGGN